MCDGNLTAAIQVIGSLATAAPGVYVLTYLVETRRRLANTGAQGLLALAIGGPLSVGAGLTACGCRADGKP